MHLPSSSAPQSRMIFVYHLQSPLPHLPIRSCLLTVRVLRDLLSLPISPFPHLSRHSNISLACVSSTRGLLWPTIWLKRHQQRPHRGPRLPIPQQAALSSLWLSTQRTKLEMSALPTTQSRVNTAYHFLHIYLGLLLVGSCMQHLHPETNCSSNWRLHVWL